MLLADLVLSEGLKRFAVTAKRLGANQAKPGAPVPTAAPAISRSNGTITVLNGATWTNSPTSKVWRWMKDSAQVGADMATLPTSLSEATYGPGSYKLTEYAANAIDVNYSNSNTVVVPAAATAPAAMAAPTLAAGSTTIAVTRAADPSDGGSAITSYDLRHSPDGTTWTVVAMTTNPQTITGLTNGTAYQVQTRAVNAIGAGAFSPSASASPAAAATAPAQMSAPTVTRGDSLVNVTRAAAPSDGGSAITSYNARYSTNAGSTWTTITGIGSGVFQITGLTNGVAVLVQTWAINAVGAGTFSPSGTATPATIPAAMAAPTVVGGNAQITITRAADPASNGDAITSYAYRLSTDGGSTWGAAVAMPTSPVTVTGLTNGTAYRVQTRATNSVGDGAWGTSSAAVTPAAGAAVEFFDDFNRADTTDIATDGSGKWTRVSGIASSLRITSNQAVTAANEAGYRAEQNLGSNDMRVEAVIPGNTSSVGPFICARFTDQNNFVGIRYNGSAKSMQLWKRIAVSLTQMGAVSYVDGDIVAVEAIGNEFRAYAGVAGATLVMGPYTHTDTVASNYAGITARSTAHIPFVDNFRAKPITAFTA